MDIQGQQSCPEWNKRMHSRRFLQNAMHKKPSHHSLEVPKSDGDKPHIGSKQEDKHDSWTLQTSHIA